MSAPEFPPDVRWFLRSGGLQLRGNLRGHVTAVLLWRAGCVHSTHALADLAALQAEFDGRPFAALAVHVPTTEPETDTTRALRAMRRHAPEVVLGLDRSRQMWSIYGAQGYPTLVLVDAMGELRFVGRGEFKLERVRGAIDGLLVEGQARGGLAAVPYAPVRATVPASPTGLSQPSALCAEGELLWLADAGHRRLVQFAADGTVQKTIGGGEGSPFRWPTALLPMSGGLWVADAGAHTLLRVDADGSATTVCGTGKRGNDRFGGGFGTQQAICSPMGLALASDGMRVAMAGSHQLWQFDPDTTAMSAWLGSGEALRRDGGHESAFAQPMGLCLVDNVLWVADAGNGALRAIELGHLWVRTVSTQLSRPVAVALHAGVPLVADAWLGAVVAVRSGQQPEVIAGPQQGLVEPTALCVVGDRLYIADAGADSLFVVDLASPKPQTTCRPLVLRGLPPVVVSAAPSVVQLRSVALRAFAGVNLVLPLPLADGESIANGTLASLRIANDGGTVLATERNASVAVEGGRVLIDNLAIGEPGTGGLRILIEVEVATAAGGQRRTFRFALPVDAMSDGAAEALLA